MKTPQLSALLMFAAISAMSAAPVARPCKVLSSADRSRLLEYVTKKYKVPPALAIAIVKESFVPSTCFRKLEFKLADGKGSFHAELFLSPDFRFLTPDLLDSTVDPILEERRKEEAFAANLTRGSFPSEGPRDAPVTLTIFSDFQCPYCAQLQRMLKNDILPKEGNTTRVIFRYFPLDMHPWAKPAAQATACAQEQGDEYFWQTHDFLFEDQREITSQNLEDRLQKETKAYRKFDTARYSRCVATKQTAAQVERDIKFRLDNDINGTPTMFINAQRVAGGVVAPEQLRTLIREARATKTASAGQSSGAAVPSNRQ